MTDRTPCSEPNSCEDGEPCARHEEEQAHAAGEHEFCGVTCEVQMPTEPMRNFVIARGYPGTAGALDELLRRARAAGRAEGIREAADLADNNDDCDCGGCDTCIMRNFAAELRRLADDNAPPSTLRQAHAAKVLRDEAAKIRAASPKHYMCDSGFGDPACTYEEVAELIERHAAEADETTEEPTA